MKRRQFVRKASLAAAGGAVISGCSGGESEGGAAAIQTRPRVNWRLTSSFPRSLDTIFGAAEVLANRVSEITAGRFTIRVFPGGELVPATQVLETVQKGTVQMGHTASYYFTGLNPALAFDCTVPFGLNARQFAAWMYYGEGLELTRGLFADFNIINLQGGNTGVQMGGWFRHQVETLADFRGLKMRIPGFGGQVMAELGANVQMLAGGEIYPALERGVIDAAEWSGPYDDEKLGFYQIAKNYYYPGWWEPGPGLSFYINRDDWAKLPSDYKAALESAAAEANLGMMANYDAKNPPALARLLDSEGVTLRPFSEEVMRRAQEITFDILASEAASDAGYRAVYDSYDAWRISSNRWLDTAENTYATFAFQGGG